MERRSHHGGNLERVGIRGPWIEEFKLQGDVEGGFRLWGATKASRLTVAGSDFGFPSPCDVSSCVLSQLNIGQSGVD